MKRSALIRVILYFILAAALLGILLSGLKFDRFGFLPSFWHSESVSEGTLLQNHNVPASQIQKLSIDWASGSIILEPGDGSDITVTETGNDASRPAVLKQSGHTLIVEYCDSEKIRLGTNLGKDLTITVPADWQCKELEIDAASTEVTVTDLTIEEVNIETASGSSTFADCHVKSLEMSSASGSLDFTGTLRELEFSGASANATLQLYNVPKSIRMDSMSGDLDLTLPEDCSFTVSKDMLGGSFETDFEVDNDLKDDHISHHGGSHSGSECKIDVDGMSADIRITKGDYAAREWGKQ